jgi:hypothetical protein
MEKKEWEENYSKKRSRKIYFGKKEEKEEH